MSERIHALAYRLFGKSSIDECGLQDIRTLAERYPYFAPAQFLLLEKLKRTGSEEYQAQSQKAVLYYHNPIEFEQFLSSDRFYTELDLEDSFVQPSSPEISEVSPGMHEEEIVEEEERETGTETEQETEETIPMATESEVMSEDMAIAEDIIHPDAAEPEPEEVPSMKAIPVEDDDTIEEETGTVTETEEETSEEAIPMATEPEVMSEDMAIAEDIIHPEATEPEPEELPSMTATPVEESPKSEAVSQGVEGPSIETPSASIPSTSLPSISAPSSDAPLTFEPFHTVDYFASQGIKLSQEEAGSGKFGKQLKSFTEWLRTMKRLPPPEVSARLDRSSEKTVQSLAEGSVNDADIVTEAMAEVWIKQGKPEKALEVYNKLSLLNPSKKAYFAAKIDHLKR